MNVAVAAGAHWPERGQEAPAMILPMDTGERQRRIRIPVCRVVRARAAMDGLEEGPAWSIRTRLMRLGARRTG